LVPWSFRRGRQSASRRCSSAASWLMAASSATGRIARRYSSCPSSTSARAGLRTALRLLWERRTSPDRGCRFNSDGLDQSDERRRERTLVCIPHVACCITGACFNIAHEGASR
jgi:hypothetical protein